MAICNLTNYEDEDILITIDGDTFVLDARAVMKWRWGNYFDPEKVEAIGVSGTKYSLHLNYKGNPCEPEEVNKQEAWTHAMS